MKKFDPKRKVWIVSPHCHGNGGWCGQSVLSSKRGMQLQRAVKINPSVKYDVYEDWFEFGRLGATRICFKPDANKSLYYWQSDEKRWIKI